MLVVRRPERLSAENRTIVFYSITCNNSTLFGGYAIVAVTGVNGSPTCGATQTIDYMDIVKNKEALDLSLEELMHPRLEKVSDLERRVRVPGSGFFFGSLIEELGKRNLDTKVIGCDLLNEPQEEAERIAGLLKLQR